MDSMTVTVPQIDIHYITEIHTIHNQLINCTVTLHRKCYYIKAQFPFCETSSALVSWGTETSFKFKTYVAKCNVAPNLIYTVSPKRKPVPALFYIVEEGTILI
jgi:hypothetical protein